MNQGARNKLRNMGGIMASSPKLMQAAFQAGGPVMPVPPSMQFNDVARSRIGPPVAGLGRIAPMMPPPAMSGPAPMMPAESAPGRFVAGQGLDTSVTDSFFGGTDLGEGSISEAASPLPEEDPFEALLSASEEFSQSVSVPRKQRAKSAGDVGAPVQRPTPNDPAAEPTSQTRPVVSRDVNALEGPEATGLGGQVRPSDVEEVAAESAAGDEPIVPPELLEDGPNREEVRNNALSSLDKSYEEKLALFKKVYNIDEGDKARDRAMNLAMIGLAIAAGQSPDALTNIAQGTIAGLQSGEARRRKREDKIEKVKALSLDAALKEQAAQQNFARQLRLKSIELGNKSQYRDSPTTRKEGVFGDVEVYLPTRDAAQRGVEPLPADPTGLDRKYKQSVEGRQRVFDKLQEAENLLNEYEISGIGGALARARSAAGASVPSFLKDVVGLEGGAVTPQQEYDALMRGIAAQFTPIILGESGRTISDGDRQRVAEILGFAVDRTAGTIGQYTGTAFTSKGQLQAALNEVEGILGGHYSQIDNVYSRYRPEQYTSILESTQKQAEGQRQGRRLVYDPDKGLTEK